MSRSKICAVALVLLCSGCKRESIPVVCAPSGANVDAVEAFKVDFSISLQEMPVCSGVKLIMSDPFKDSPAATKEIEKSKWRLVVSVIPQDDTDNGKQLWMLDHEGHGTGVKWSTPKSMASSVCSIVKGKGGTIQSSE